MGLENEHMQGSGNERLFCHGSKCLFGCAFEIVFASNKKSKTNQRLALNTCVPMKAAFAPIEISHRTLLSPSMRGNTS